MPRAIHRLAGVVVLCAVAMHAAAAGAALSTHAEARFTENAFPGSINGNVVDDGMDFASVTLDRPGTMGQAEAHAAPGALRIAGRVTNGSSNSGTQALASALWTDLLDFQIFTDEPFSGSAPGFTASITVTGSGDLFGSARAGDDFPGADIRGPGTYEFSGLIRRPVELSVVLGGQATVTALPATRGFEGAVRWNGISAVVLPGTSEVPRFTVSSASGFDYAIAAPVPEPGAYALMLTGLLAVAMWRKRGRVQGRA